MACMDIVVASAVDGLGRVFDYYTPTMATPKLDDFYGGTQGLTSAVAVEYLNVTTLMFRKKLTGSQNLSYMRAC